VSVHVGLGPKEELASVSDLGEGPTHPCLLGQLPVEGNWEWAGRWARPWTCSSSPPVVPRCACCLSKDTACGTQGGHLQVLPLVPSPLWVRRVVDGEVHGEALEGAVLVHAGHLADGVVLLLVRGDVPNPWTGLGIAVQLLAARRLLDLMHMEKAATVSVLNMANFFKELLDAVCAVGAEHEEAHVHVLHLLQVLLVELSVPTKSDLDLIEVFLQKDLKKEGGLVASALADLAAQSSS
jgi:hypothetical protein